MRDWWTRHFARDASEADEDMFHRVWQCRANTGEIFDKIQHLVQKATQAKDTFECFWLRGGCATILDFARHEVGVFGVNLEVAC